MINALQLEDEESSWNASGKEEEEILIYGHSVFDGIL